MLSTSAAGLRETTGLPVSVAAHLARVKRWGKSPPPGWQHPGHGKPRVEQGQIGGEGWPSPYATSSKEWLLRPSGRLLESRSDPGPRGMIIGRAKEIRRKSGQRQRSDRIRLTDSPANFLANPAARISSAPPAPAIPCSPALFNPIKRPRHRFLPRAIQILRVPSSIRGSQVLSTAQFALKSRDRDKIPPPAPPHTLPPAP